MVLVDCPNFFYAFSLQPESTWGAIDERRSSILNPWFREIGIEPSSVRYSSYTDPNLISSGSDIIFVGVGYKNGSASGFYIELNGNKIVDAKEIDPNATSYHATDAREALYKGALLKHAIVERAARNHLRR